jgi:hypothetical protein
MSISRLVTEPWVCRLLISLIIIMANNNQDLRVSHARATVACAASAFATYEVTKTWNMGEQGGSDSPAPMVHAHAAATPIASEGFWRLEASHNLNPIRAPAQIIGALAQ